MEQLKTALQKQYGDQTDAYIAAVKKAYPNTTRPANYVDIDTRFRPGAIKQADQKATTGTAPVYMYLRGNRR